MKKIIKCNAFDGAPGGTSGTLNYQYPLNTHASDEVSQNPENFQRSDNNKAIGSRSNTAKDVPDPMNMKSTIDQIYNKKKVPTADQVKAGLDYELHNMIKPDKRKAKELVLGNLRQDSDYYGKLHQLNIDDKSMKVDINEISKNVNAAETKKIFAEMAKKKDTKFVVNSNIVNVIKEMWKEKKKRRAWQQGDPTL